MESTTQFVRCWAIIAAEDTTNAEVDAMHIRNNTNRDADFVMVGGAASTLGVQQAQKLKSLLT